MFAWFSTRPFVRGQHARTSRSGCTRGWVTRLERSQQSVRYRATISMRNQERSCASAQQNEQVLTEAFEVDSLVREELRDMAPYTPILPYEVLAQQLGREPNTIIKLDANENPYGVCTAVREALASAPFPHIYPDPESRELREALASFTGVPSSRLLVGHGADELLDLIFRLVIRPNRGDTIVNAPPTFGMYQFDAELNGARVVEVWRQASDGFRFPIEQVERYFAQVASARARGDEQPYPKIIFVTCPNNPDGSRILDADLRRLLRLPTLIVLDEAYIEFAEANEHQLTDSNDEHATASLIEPPSRIRWVLEYPNLVVLRTFSKWAALAGLRVGYGAFPESLMPHLWKIKQPYNVNVAGQIAALVALQERTTLFQQVALMKAERRRFYEQLRRPQFAWLHPYPSQSNFVLCRVQLPYQPTVSGTPNASARHVRDFLRERGILIRYYDAKGLSDCIRISMGTPTQMDHLYEALEAYAKSLNQT
ncbi:hypothetical protein CCYA_CCYA01G0162 [Cyanidiococcus yangmingshanensis]|nr:hypothetical protein CCYA_CCYA01G0162 [Cyanidiococcus yangmingshanensis]